VCAHLLPPPAHAGGVPVTAPYRDAVRSMLHDRLLDAAAQVFAEQGWRRLTMAKVGDCAGVSRQTVYNEFGTKQQLADALILRELETFLTIVRELFEREDELVPAVRSAVAGALTAAGENPLLRSVLDSGQSGDTDLLPFIVQSPWLVDRATEVLTDLALSRFPDLPLQGARLVTALESVVRLVLSHITLASRPVEETAEALAWIAGRVLTPS
jgi:AcrR family transcriptional regulator